MKFSDLGNDSLTRSAVIHKVMETYGVNRETALRYLDGKDPDIMSVFLSKADSDEGAAVFRYMVWGDMTDEEIQAHCQAESAAKLFEEVE